LTLAKRWLYKIEHLVKLFRAHVRCLQKFA
jgi:hypothetical protein